MLHVSIFTYTYLCLSFVLALTTKHTKKKICKQHKHREVLKLDDTNVKALFKLAQSYELLDTTTDLETAFTYIKKAKKAHPTNAAVCAKFRQIKNILKKQNKKDTNIFHEMFSNSDIYADIPVPKPLDMETSKQKNTCDKVVQCCKSIKNVCEIL